MDEREQAVVEAVKKMKKTQFGLTGIKVEFEAQFNRARGMGDHPENCDYCGGEGNEECDECDGEGDWECGSCEGTGDWGEDSCEECDGTGVRRCGVCDGSGMVTCSNATPPKWVSEKYCHDWLMKELSKIGLAKRTTTEKVINGIPTKWRPVSPLMYAVFYRDGSVDSEFTFTLLLDDPKNVLLLPKISNIWKKLGDTIGNGIGVGNAGMHMALLNSEGAIYPTDPSDEDKYIRFPNFNKSMQLLLPALYFLGASNENTRPLRFREPRIGSDLEMNTKYSAINYTGGGLEFRVFDTCYDTPEQILDNVAVMGKCLRFFTSKYTRNHLDKITKQVRFGRDGGLEVKRLFITTEHVSLLNRGLKLIKPDYLTIRQIKKQRAFNYTLKSAKDAEWATKVRALSEYKEYEERFGWGLVMKEHSYIARFLEDKVSSSTTRPPIGDPETIKEAEKYAKERVAKEKAEKVEEKQWLDDKVEEFKRSAGRWSLG